MGFIHLVLSHPVVAGFIAFLLFSNFVDALKPLAPKPTDGRLYVFLWTMTYGLAGNVVSAIRFLLKALSPKNEQILEELGSVPAPVSGADGAVAHDPHAGQK
jgi:hypothetical protein